MRVPPSASVIGAVQRTVIRVGSVSEGMTETFCGAPGADSSAAACALTKADSSLVMPLEPMARTL